MPSAKPKHSQSKQPPTSSTESKPNVQQTISGLFSSVKRSAQDQNNGDLRGHLPDKRSKGACVSEASEKSNLPKTVGPIDMYQFASSRTQPGGNVIDLTGTPDGSPIKKQAAGTMRHSNFATSAGPKKLVVKNLKNVSRPDPDDYYNKVWMQLDAALTAIFQYATLPLSMEELYRGVEFSCRQDRAPDLFKRLCEKCHQGVIDHFKKPLVQCAESCSDVDLLRSMVSAWSGWSKQLDIIRSIFFYLDRSYLLHSALLPGLHEMGVGLFRDHVLADDSLRSRILQGACDLISNDRTGEQSMEDTRLLQNSINMFHGLGVYTKHFEPVLLAESERYYCSWADQAVASNDLAGYVEMSDRLMAQEMTRATKLKLEDTTIKDLQNYLEEILVVQRQERLTAEEDVDDLLAKGQSDVLQRLFSLLERRYLGEKLRPPFEAHIKNSGSDIVFDEKRELEMVSRLLDFKRSLDSVWATSFQRHEGLGHSLREAFEYFINKTKRSNMTWGTDNPKPGEMIAKHVDTILKGGRKAVRTSGIGIDGARKVADDDEAASSADEDLEITRSLDQVLDLFRFVHGKAVFEAFYKRDLARRLLLGRSASADAEKSMLTRLKSECGAGFTHNLEQMFKDVEMAREEMSSYKQMLEDRNGRNAFDLSVNVLSASAWPTYPDVKCLVPENVAQATVDFEQHYKAKHVGRKLEWKNALAHCQLKASFPKGNKEIVVSSFQAIVLLAFNGGEEMSYNDVKAASGLEDIEIKRTLQSLACARFRVLSKNPKGKDVNTTDTFTINDAFSHPKYRIKINQIQAKETKAENQQTHERVAQDREFETQAAIVRIMKGRKTITHAELVSEVIVATKTRGVLDPADIKRNIERLIEKDYMERNEDEQAAGRNVYDYVA